jgi:hypothetical protein
MPLALYSDSFINVLSVELSSACFAKVVPNKNYEINTVTAFKIFRIYYL